MDPVRATERRFGRMLLEGSKTLARLAAHIEVQGFEEEGVREMYQKLQEQLAEAWELGNAIKEYREKNPREYLD